MNFHSDHHCQNKVYQPFIILSQMTLVFSFLMFSFLCSLDVARQWKPMMIKLSVSRVKTVISQSKWPIPQICINPSHLNNNICICHNDNMEMSLCSLCLSLLIWMINLSSIIVCDVTKSCTCPCHEELLRWKSVCYKYQIWIMCHSKEETVGLY